MSERKSPFWLPQVALQRRVIDGPRVDARGLLLVPLDRREAEVHELGHAAGRDQDVCPLDIAVCHAVVERVLQAPRQPDHHRDRRHLVDVHADLEQFAEVRPLDILHNHIVVFIFIAVIEDLDDVGVAEPHARLGFLVEALDEAGLGDEAAAEHLDGDRLTAPEPLSPIDAREGPLGEVEQDLATAQDEAAPLPFLHSLDLPARHEPFAQQRPDDGFQCPVLGIGTRLGGLFACDQTQQGRVFEEELRVEFGHRRVFLIKPKGGAAWRKPAISGRDAQSYHSHPRSQLPIRDEGLVDMW